MFKNRNFQYAQVVIVAGLLFFLSCNPKLQNYQYEIPDQPVGIKIKANTGKTFTLYYYVQNKETSFDGYNVYVTRESTALNGPNQMKASYPAYTKNGGSPTLVHNLNEVNVNQPQSFTIETFAMFNNFDPQRNTLYFPFETGIRYYFKITAHTIFDMESSPSNEVSAVAIP